MNFKYLKDDSKILRAVSQPNSLWKALRFSFPIAILGWQLGQRKVGGECIALWHNCRSQRLSVSRQDLSDPGKKSEQVSKSTKYQQQLWPINITFVAPASRWDLSSVTTGTNARGSSLSQFSRLIKLGLLGLLSSLKEKKKSARPGLVSICASTTFFGNSKGVKPAYGACCQQWVSQPTASQ